MKLCGIFDEKKIVKPDENVFFRLVNEYCAPSVALKVIDSTGNYVSAPYLLKIVDGEIIIFNNVNSNLPMKRKDGKIVVRYIG